MESPWKKWPSKAEEDITDDLVVTDHSPIEFPT
jgi:hypothetical protein